MKIQAMMLVISSPSFSKFDIYYLTCPMAQQQQGPLSYQMIYYQLLGQYTTLTSSYQSQVQQNFELYRQLQSLMQEQISLLQQEVSTQSTLPSPPAPLDSNTQHPREMFNYAPHRSSENSSLRSGPEQRVYKCTYPNCTRTYRSSVSMNLHIKLKHNGGTKKEREAAAKLLIEAEKNGEARPQLSLNLPPGFLEQFRKNYQYTKKYNM